MNKQNPKSLSYFYHPYDIINWLKADPLEEEISYNERQRRYMKYSVIKAKLDYLCPDNWDTKNFHQFIFYMPDKRIKVSGNIDVVVRYHYQLEDGSDVREVYRTLAGAATFNAEDYAPNEHWAATVKSLAIANAVQVLGPQMGWNLNPEEDEEPQQDIFGGPIPAKKVIHNGKESILMPPPPDIRKKYVAAIAAGDKDTATKLEKIYNFKI